LKDMLLPSTGYVNVTEAALKTMRSLERDASATVDAPSAPAAFATAALAYCSATTNSVAPVSDARRLRVIEWIGTVVRVIGENLLGWIVLTGTRAGRLYLLVKSQTKSWRSRGRSAPRSIHVDGRLAQNSNDSRAAIDRGGM
jgi:hypothetical protein